MSPVEGGPVEGWGCRSHQPDEDCSPEAFRAFVDELLAEPEIESLDAAVALRALRVDANA
ncbi:MAG: hypothetical protein WCB67_09600 [Solirubrobacteraceae bacterium]